MAFTKVVGAGIHTLSNITSHNVHSSGIITATKFDGPFDNINVSGAATFTGNVTIGGTLTYEDVTNIDAVGLITARDGIFIPDLKKLEIGNVAGAGDLTSDDLKGISQKSCGILKDMGTGIEWVQSYVTGDKVYCVYNADNEQLIKDHASTGGFPANSISEVKNIISPKTAE